MPSILAFLKDAGKGNECLIKNKHNLMMEVSLINQNLQQNYKMKKTQLLTCIVICIAISLKLSAQQGYRGFFLEGGSDLFYRYFNDEFIDNNLTTRNELRLGYFINKSHKVSIGPEFTSFPTFVRDSTGLIIDERTERSLSFSIAYEYIHWFGERIGIGGRVAASQIGQNFNIPLSVSFYARPTSRIDLSLQIGSASIYSKTDFQNNTLSPFPSGRSRRELINIPNSLFTDIGLTYRFNANEFLEEGAVFEGVNRSVEVGLSYQNQISKSINDDPFFEVDSELTRLGLEGWIYPLEKSSYGAIFAYLRYASTPSATQNEISITPSYRRNWYYADGFGMYIQGGLQVGLNLQSRDEYRIGPTLSSGLQYILSKRVRLALSMLNFDYTYHKLGGLDFTYSVINMSFLRGNRLSASVLF